MIRRLPISGRFSALLLLSAALHFACFVRYPGNPDWDVHHAIFAARNFLVQGQFKSLNPLADYGGDLAEKARLRWMMHWPPGHSLMYVAAMSLGLSPGAATKLLGLLCIVIGGVGWIYLARFLGATGYCVAVIAAVYPWLPYVGQVYFRYTNEYPAMALAPWICFAILQIQPLSEPSSERWDRLVIAAFLAGISMSLKYSLAPALIASFLYMLWLDGSVITRRRVARMGIFSGVLVLVGLLPWLMSRMHGEVYPLPKGEGRVLSLPAYGSHILNNTLLQASGWDRIVTYLLEEIHLHLPRAVVLCFASLLLLVIWARHFRHFPWRARQKSFGVLLLLLTAGLWLMLGLMTDKVGMQWDFTSMARLYNPVALLWLLFCGVSLGQLTRKDLFRSAAFYSLAIPIAITAVLCAGTGLIGKPYARMPGSEVAWPISGDSNDASFLSNLAVERGRKPDLLVSDPWDMTELGVPCFYTQALQDHKDYWSSVNLEVWAIVEPAKEGALVENFRRASVVERIRVPVGFPFVFYIFKFTAEPH